MNQLGELDEQESDKVPAILAANGGEDQGEHEERIGEMRGKDSAN